MNSFNSVVRSSMSCVALASKLAWYLVTTERIATRSSFSCLVKIKSQKTSNLYIVSCLISGVLHRRIRILTGNWKYLDQGRHSIITRLDILANGLNVDVADRAAAITTMLVIVAIIAATWDMSGSTKVILPFFNYKQKMVEIWRTLPEGEKEDIISSVAMFHYLPI